MKQGDVEIYSDGFGRINFIVKGKPSLDVSEFVYASNKSKLDTHGCLSQTHYTVPVSGVYSVNDGFISMYHVCLAGDVINFLANSVFTITRIHASARIFRGTI